MVSMNQIGTLRYYDYSDPENMMRDARIIDYFKDKAMESVEGVYNFINYLNELNFKKDISAGFDELEYLNLKRELVN